MKKALAFLSVVLLAFCLLFVSCNKKKAEATTGAPQAKVYKIGYVCNNFNDTFQTFIVDAAKEFIATKPDMSIEFVDSQEDVVRQQDQVNTLIAKNVDALIVVPVDTSAMGPVTKAAKEAHIPLCYVNRNPFGDKPVPENVYFVGSKEINAGEFQMELMGKLLNGEGGIGILLGKLDNEGTIKRTEGVKKVISEKYPNIKVLAEESGNWQRDQGMTLTENWLTSYGKNLNGICSNNDEMALGAVQALKAAGRTDVYVMGVDAIDDAKEAVKNGTMAATVLQDSVGQGRGSTELLYNVLHGGKEDPIKWVDFVLLTKDNVGNY